MIEAVGHEFWGTYFQTIDRVLAPGGRVAIQAITMPHDRMLATRGTHTWINKYIFPGGFLPSVEAIEPDHPRRDRAAADRPAVVRAALRRDPAAVGRRSSPGASGCSTSASTTLFVRIWHFYLYSRAGFASGYLDVHQIASTSTKESR